MDEVEVYFQVESLWDRGSLAIPQVPDGQLFGRIGVDGQKYAPYGPGTAFLALGHHALGRAAAALLGIPREDAVAWSALVSAVTSLALTTWAALAVLLTYRAARALGADEPRALLIAALLGLGTHLWVYAGLFYTEPMTTAVLLGAVICQLEGRRALAAVAVLVLVLLKSTNVIVAPAVAVLAAWPPRAGLKAGLAELAREPMAAVRRAAPVAIAALLAQVALLEWNRWRFGDPFELGYSLGEHFKPGAPPRALMLSGLPRGLFGLLLSPGKSVFLFAPPVVLGLAWMRHLLRVAPGVVAAIAAAAAGTLVVYGAYCLWEGGYSFGPRYLVPLVPLLLLPLAAGPAPSRAAVAVTLAVGVPIQLLGISVSFLEDQALGATPGRMNQRYYELREDVPPGRPKNVYNLAYCPLVSYPPILLAHLRGETPDEVGRGIDLLPLHLGRIRRHGGAAIPPWAPAIPPLVGLALLAAGVAGLRRGRESAVRPATEIPRSVS